MLIGIIQKVYDSQNDIFLPTPPSHLLKVTNCGMAGKIYYILYIIYIAALAYHIISKQVESVRNCSFNLHVRFFLHIDT